MQQISASYSLGRVRLQVCQAGLRHRRLTGCKAGLSEDVLARLKAAEEEAAMLRKELAAAKSGKEPKNDVIEGKPKRIDSVDRRETVFAGGKQERSAWLSESDVDFFTGGGPPGESSNSDTEDPEVQQTVQKRLAIGIVATLGLAAFGLIPTEQLRNKPEKPLYFYVVPLLRIKDLLAECKPIIADADWSTLRNVLPRVLGVPNNARSNMDNIVALLDNSKTAERAEKLASEFIELLDSIDFNKYYDAMPTKTLSGLENSQYSEFSGKALVAAQNRLDQFLSLIPLQAREDAESQMLRL